MQPDAPTPTPAPELAPMQAYYRERARREIVRQGLHLVRRWS